MLQAGVFKRARVGSMGARGAGPSFAVKRAAQQCVPHPRRRGVPQKRGARPRVLDAIERQEASL